MTGVLKYTERKCVKKFGWLQILTSEKCTVLLKAWMTASILKEVNIAPLKECIAGTNLFLEISILLHKELLKQWMTASSPVKINRMAVCQRMFDYLPFCDKNKYPQRRIQRVSEAGIPVWAPKFGAQKIFSGHFIFNGLLFSIKYDQSKGLKRRVIVR